MRNTKLQRSTILLLTGVALANFSLRAEDTIRSNDRPYQGERNDRSYSDTDRRDNSREYRNDYRGSESMHKHIQASKLIGKEVKNGQNERLGKIDDLILSDNFGVRFAVLSVGGALGVGDSKIVVPVSALSCTGDGICLSASKDELKNAAKTPSGEWAFASGEEWTKDVDGYYGHPMRMTMRDHRDYQSSESTPWYERESLRPADQVHENVRAIQGQGAKELINHDSNANLYREWNPQVSGDQEDSTVSTSDTTLRQSINSSIHRDYDARTARGVRVSVENGTVTLRGTVPNETEKRNIESRVKAINGVSRVNNQLNVRD